MDGESSSTNTKSEVLHDPTDDEELLYTHQEPKRDEIKLSRRSLSNPASRWNPLPETATTLQSFVVFGVDDLSVSPDCMSTEDLERCCTVMEQSNVSVRAENGLLESYLTAVDPTLIDNMDKILEATTAAIVKAERTAQLGMMAAVTSQTPRDTKESSTSSPHSTGPSQTASSKVGAFAISDKGPKVQPQQKIEIVQREMDILKASHDENQSNADKVVFLLECQKEGLTADLADLQAARKNFEDSLSKEWVDPILKKVPGEKLIEFFENQNRQDALTLAAFKTRIKNLKIRQEAASNRLKEMGDNLHYVDYEQLTIETEEVEKNLSDAQKASTELLRANSRYLSLLNQTRSRISHLSSDRDRTKTKIRHLEDEKRKMLEKENKLRRDIERCQKKINEIVSRSRQYTVPGVMDYVKLKAEVGDIKTALKAMQRKNKCYQFDEINKAKTHKSKGFDSLQNPEAQQGQGGENSWVPTNSTP